MHYKEANTFHRKKIQKNRKELVTEYLKCNSIYNLRQHCLFPEKQIIGKV